MNFLIKDVEINGFKCFNSINISNISPNLNVLDGPNGYGKSSFFDAIEFLFFGKIRRYDMLLKRIHDDRAQNDANVHFLHNKAFTGDLKIKATIQKDGRDQMYCRILKRADFQSSQSLKVPLKTSLHTINDSGELVDASITSLPYLDETKYHYLHYVEQDETAHILKQKRKERKDGISDLFQTSEFKDEIVKMKLLYKTLDTYKKSNDGMPRKAMLTKYLKENTELALRSEIPTYKKLFTENNAPFDRMEIDFNEHPYEQFTDELNDLQLIKKIMKNKSGFLQCKINASLEFLQSHFLDLRYYVFFNRDFNNYEKIAKEYTFQTNKLTTLMNIDVNNFTEYFNDDTLTIEENAFNKILDKDFDYIAYSNELKKIKQSHDKLNQYNKSIVEFTELRTQLIYNFTKNHKGSDLCPTCGTEFENHQNLIKRFDIHQRIITELQNSEIHTFNEQCSIFLNSFIDTIQKNIRSYLSKNSYSITYVHGVAHSVNNLKDEMSDIKRNLESLDILETPLELSHLYQENPLDDDELNENVQSWLNKLKTDLHKESDVEYNVFMDHAHRNFFNSDKSFSSLTLDDFLQKEEYIKYQFTLYKNKLLKETEIELTKLTSKLNQISLVSDNLKRVVKVYEECINNFEDGLIEAVNILFHVYSGRIIQDFQNGVGLFIENKKNSIIIREHGQASYDALLSMSSGQISALILSFVLALHKRYSSNNKILLIDDPLQTFDEINTAGFIDLLRHEFKEHQIFVSTHEEQLSAYMRYKFKAHDISSIKFNLKDIALNC